MTTPLCAAIANRHMDATKLLLEHGANPSKLGHYDTLPIQLAIINDDIDTIELLIDYGVSIRDTRVMYTAAKYNNISMIEWFLDNGVDINSRDAIDALKAAVMKGNPHTVKLLLDRGVDVNGISGSTALHSAVYAERVDMVRTLINAGATLKSDSKGHTPLYYAGFQKDGRMVKILKKVFGS